MGVLGTSRNERERSQSPFVGLVYEVSKKLIAELLDDVDISLFRLRVSQCNTTQISLDSKVVDLRMSRLLSDCINQSRASIGFLSEMELFKQYFHLMCCVRHSTKTTCNNQLQY